MRVAAIAAVFLSAAGIGTACAAPQFSADAVETEPGRDMKYVRLFMGENASRFEYQVSGQPVIQIVRPAEGKMLTLFPLTRNYTEQQIPPGAAMSDVRAAAPCEPSPDTGCRKEADEAGASPSKIERWTVTYKGQPGESRIWWDAQRKIVVRQEFPDGREMQATMRGTMNFENRPVENWEFLYMSPNGTYRRGLALYAQDLGFAVAEQQPGGEMRELRNVQPGAQDAKLFEVPADYKKLDAFTPASPAQPIASAPAQSYAAEPPAVPAPFAQPAMQPAMTAAQRQPLQYANPPVAAPGGQPQSWLAMPSTAMPQSGPMMPSAAMPQYGTMAPSAMMPPAAPAQPAQQPLTADAQPQPVQPHPMQPQPMQPQPMMPPAFPGAPYGAPWTSQGEAPKAGAGVSSQAPGGFPFQAIPGSPYVSPGNGQPPIAGPGTQSSTAPAPGNAPPLAPYGWPFGPAPQLQTAEKPVPGNDPSRKP